MSHSRPLYRLIDADGPADLDDVRRLFRAYAAEFAGSIAGTLCFQGFEAELAGLPGRYGPPSGTLILARDGVEAAGCVGSRDLGDGIVEMKRLYVGPAWRGHGLGRLLVGEVLRRASDAGYRRIVLDTVPEMASAIALYRSFGFATIPPYWASPVEPTVFLGRDLPS